MNALSISGAKPGKIADICYNSRNAVRKGAFVAITGNAMDGHDYIMDAVKRGATTIIAERKPEKKLPRRVTLALVKNSREALATMANYFYDSPTDYLKVIGITGTNGKTTVTYLVESILGAGGSPCARIGTVEYKLLAETIPAVTTTPESLDLQKMFQTLKESETRYCALEVSSHALVQHRVDHIKFRSAVFTNLTQDHLDYHHDMEEYFASKVKLFKERSPEISILNSDDPYGLRLLDIVEGQALLYGLKKNVDVTVENLYLNADSIVMTLKTPSGSSPVRSNLTGRHNVYNIMAAASVGIAEGMGVDEIAEGIGNLEGVPGRMERIDEGQPFTAIVDYAHTPDALAHVIRAARELTGHKVITLFGCGGDRDKTKRPLMGKTASTLSDTVIVTSDNPRGEHPEKIIEDILDGIENNVKSKSPVHVEVDRKRAIKTAVKLAGKGDIVLIAGKGHEDYQIIGKQKVHFDDREELRNAIKERYGEV